MQNSPSRLDMIPWAGTIVLACCWLACQPPAESPAVEPATPQVASVEPAPLGVFSDTGRLHATLALSGGEEMARMVGLGSGHPLSWTGANPSRQREHAALLQILQQNGVEVLDIAEVLQSAIDNARQTGNLAGWLQETFPTSAERIVERIDEIDARSLLNRRDEHFYLENEAGDFDPLFPGVTAMYWARDFAAMTPKGIVIGNGRYLTRSFENDYARFMFRHADALKDAPIAFDAIAEEVYLDGGDLIVLDEQTLLLGVGNRSSREAAPKLAQRLNMDVLAVAMPDFDGAKSLRRRLLHLDTSFNVVGWKTAVALPFFYEKAWIESHPLKPILRGLTHQVEAIKAAMPQRETFSEGEDVTKLLDNLPQIGWLTRYAATTGEAEELGTKLVDYLRGQGWRIIPLGGEQGDLPLEKYVLERVLYELHWQGANVVQLAPGQVIAYEHNVHTNRALRAAGIEVQTFPGAALAQGSGGPHCLLMPLSREALPQPPIEQPPVG
ncbi:MAG: arginine deiminase family protein [Acidobacteriota bacterium]